MQQDSEALDIAQALRVVRRRALLVIFCTVLVAAAAFGFSKSQEKEYTATASLIFRNTPLSQQVAGLSAATSSSELAQQVSNIELVGLGDMAAKTAKRLGLSEEEVRESIGVAGQGESDVVAVSSTTTSPALAARIATIYAREFVAEQQRANRQFFRSALALVDRQLSELPPEQRFGTAAAPLQNRAQVLEFLEGLRYDSVDVAQRALPPSSPSSPKTAENTLLGAMLGLLIGIGLAFVLERLDRERRLREPGDLEETYGASLLGAVPASKGLARAGQGKGPVDLTPEEAEAFQMIRGRLRFSPGGKDLRSVLVLSAERGNGTTTVARGLAEAAARMGARVLLLEADLRSPALAGRLGLRPGPTFPDVLSGAAPMDVAIQSVDVGVPAGQAPGRKTLDVLACGPAPSNPGELLESHAMEIVLDRARSIYDLVVIDAPPPTVVSDPLSLLGRADGVLVVSWVGRSLRTEADRLYRTLLGSGAARLGLIANGVRPGALGSYEGTSDKVATAPLPPGPAPVNGGSPSGAPVSTAGA